MCWRVVKRPRVNRNEPNAHSWESPNAKRTWDGSKLPEVHADPEDAAMPCKSSCNSNASPSTPKKLKLAL